jgi:hypothetical protein
MQIVNQRGRKFHFLSYLFLLIFLNLSFFSCMKRNIFYSVGGGGGILPVGGVGKVKFSPGEFDEDIYGIFEFQGVWRLERKDIVPVTGYGLFFNFREINDQILPYLGTVINVIWLRKEPGKFDFLKLNAKGEFSLVLGIETKLSKSFSFFFDIPLNVIAEDLPKYNILFGISHYIKRF